MTCSACSSGVASCSALSAAAPLRYASRIYNKCLNNELEYANRYISHLFWILCQSIFNPPLHQSLPFVSEQAQIAGFLTCPLSSSVPPVSSWLSWASVLPAQGLVTQYSQSVYYCGCGLTLLLFLSLYCWTACLRKLWTNDLVNNDVHTQPLHTYLCDLSFEWLISLVRDVIASLILINLF